MTPSTAKRPYFTPRPIDSGASPKRRGQAAFERERSGDAPLRDIGEQSKRAVEAGLAAAVGSGDNVERAQFDAHVPQRSVTGNRQRSRHVVTFAGGEPSAATSAPAPCDPPRAPRAAERYGRGARECRRRC